MVESGGLENRCGLMSTEGSNPSLSVAHRKVGEMTEWPEVHAWKACVLYPGTEGSNPSLSDTPSAFPKQALRCRLLPHVRGRPDCDL